MIRERRTEDLAPLLGILDQLADRAPVPAEQGRRAWLESEDVECSWVFDQAPVTAVPTKNVVGHVQVRRISDERWARGLAARLRCDPTELMVIGRLFVKPSRHEYGIARYLLKESAKHLQARGSIPVLEPADRALVPQRLPEKLGFTEYDIAEGMTDGLVSAVLVLRD